jgi:hypothetical protein
MSTGSDFLGPAIERAREKGPAVPSDIWTVLAGALAGRATERPLTDKEISTLAMHLAQSRPSIVVTNGGDK